MLTNRFSHLDQLMQSNGLDVVVINPGSTLTYLTGLHFHLMERPTVLIYMRGLQPILILPELEAGKLHELSMPISAVTFDDNPAGWQSAFNQAVMKLDGKKLKIGLEPTRLRFLELDYLQKAASHAQFVSAEIVFGALRLQKEEKEVEDMRKAVKIAQTALKATLPMVKPGVSESEIASELMIQLYKAGSSAELPFSPLVASGPNSANPHAVPSSRQLQKGDLVLFDWGATYNDYISDLTRTFALGELSPELVEIYEAVKAANAAGRAAGKPGLPAGDVDVAARSVITQAGFGKFFNHRTGHGIGMEAHEQPYMFGGNELSLAEGMTYTVEPGIYLQGKGGVRIEDNMVVTKEGCESLSDFTRDLRIL